jgi:hypothetical protein
MAVWVKITDSVFTSDKQDRELDGNNQVFQSLNIVLMVSVIIFVSVIVSECFQC